MMSSNPRTSAAGAPLLALLLGTVLLGSAHAQPSAPHAHGPLVIIGGALAPGNGPIYRAILDLTLTDRPLCLLATASSEPGRSLRSHLREFRRYGGETAILGLAIDRRHPERTAKARWSKRLLACGGFFFTGGDQSRLMDILRPGGISSPADHALRQVSAAGGVVAGTSAGAAMMSQSMIGDGTSSEALEHGVVLNEGEPGVWLRDGMGFLAGAVIDQHFLARGRFGRLLVALEHDKTARYGFGVDEDTALVIDDDRARVIGSAAVIIIDRGAPGQGPDLQLSRLWLLANDDQLRMASGIAQGAADKHPPAEAPTPEIPTDPWLEDTFHRLLVGFARSPADELELLEGRLLLSKERGFNCLARGPAERPRAVFAGPFSLEHRAISTP